MTVRMREWLQSFLKLGVRAEKDGIPLADVARQEDTVLRALTMLEEQPGVVLADEVGMGKTFEALGIAAATRCLRRRSRIVVVTPGPDLNQKWVSEFSRFKEMYDFGDQVCPVRQLSDFVEAVRQHPVVVAPVTMFQSGRGSGAQTYLLSLYVHWTGLHGQTARAIMARFRDGEHDRVDVHAARFLGIFTLDDVRPHLQKAFCAGRSGGPPGLHDLYKKGRLQAFENEAAVRSALYRARFVLTGQLMPLIDLLIVDEAHKLKNPGSLRTRAMRDVFYRRFRKALFLTATPFQLDVSELREVFRLFAGAKDAPKELVQQVEGILASVRDYQQRYEDFQRTWSSLDPVVASRFRTLYDRDPAEVRAVDDPSMAVVLRQIESLRELKEQAIEPGFRKWMIRSLREDKRTYRRHLPRNVMASGVDALPFLIYERYIAELFRQQRPTHKAAVEINMVSSYGAAHEGSILAEEEALPAQARVYRDLLRQILSDIAASAHEHPKLDCVIRDALDAADRGEKTLIFCSRLATLRQLQSTLKAIWQERVLARWRAVYPGAGADEIFNTREDEKLRRGRQSLLQERFHRGKDALYLALREPYLRTVAPLADYALARLPEVVDLANARLRTMRVGKTSAEDLDYQIAKRCVEQAAVILWSSENGKNALASSAIENLRNPAFLSLGLDLDPDEFEQASEGDDTPRWEISERVAMLAVGEGGSLWERLTDLLDRLPEITRRVRVVEQLARYLTYKDVPFLPDLLAEAQAAGLSTEPVESAALLALLPRFWETRAGKLWLEQLRSFLEYFVQRDEVQQLEILDGSIRNVHFVRHTAEGESRERLREAFNTPLYPMILIANEVMQEGLDLHKHCRRIVHHDLAWNPAQIEQRIGRVDRLGSLTSRLRKENPSTTLDVLYPLIRGTIDERLYRTVKLREKWLEFLLGASPNFSEYHFADAEPPPLPDRLAMELAINLGPAGKRIIPPRGAGSLEVRDPTSAVGNS